LQNIPRDESLRKAFIAEKGHVFIDADFSQIELRVIAHYTQDNRLVWAYQNGIDVHKQTIAIILGKDIEQITKEERGLGKAINFGLCYGMGVEKFAKLNNLSLSDATLYRDGFFATYPAIKHALHHYNELAKGQGFIVNMFGRRRRFKNEDNTFDAFNSLIQGTAGDICKIAMIKLSKELPKEAKLLLQVHDELLFEVPKESASEIKALIISIMERPIKGLDGKEFSVPIKVDAGVGETWADAKV
jgi:DNA polymerase-1